MSRLTQHPSDRPSIGRQLWAKTPPSRTAGIGLIVACLIGTNLPAVTDEAFETLVAENQALKEQVEGQQKQLDSLSARLDELIGSNGPTFQVASEPAIEFEDPEPIRAREPASPRVILSGAAGIGFFAGGSDSAYPHGEFRIDEARLFLDAQIIRNTYLFAEINLRTRESPDDNVDLGEFYVEFEDLWNKNRLFNVRLGRLDVPFGEEYQNRDVMQNPLITHSLADIWGIDEGIELFGQSGPVSYVIAVQNGSHDGIHDFTDDKALTTRIGWDPTNWLHLSASLMRTGEISVSQERLSEVWIGNGFFRSIGSPATTTFQADLGELDAVFQWNDGQARIAWGRADYSDDDPVGDNGRSIDFATIEAVQTFARHWYAAARYSLIQATGGYPLPGLGSFGKYFFSPLLTDELWRLSLGFGYRPAENLVLKFEYTFEEGSLSNGSPRTDSDLFSTIVGVSF